MKFPVACLSNTWSQLLSAAVVLSSIVQADPTDITGPAGSGAFGTSVTVLPNGNFIVTDPGYDIPGAASDVGAVYLYDPQGVQVSKLTGSSTYDAVGSGGVVMVGSGNFVVLSPNWSNGIKNAAGAVTWGNGTTGVAGTVSPQNSLVGSRSNDAVGSSGIVSGGITVLTNGHYVVSSPNWGDGTANSIGAVTQGDGNSGVTGVVSAANSLVGSHLNDQIGRYQVVPLKNGNYVVRSPEWDNGAVTDAGAVTWGSGSTVTAGVVSAAISLVGTTTNDQVGYQDDYRGGVTTLANGHYVVHSPLWDNGTASNAGAVTWADGFTGRAGALSAANSLVGTTANDFKDWVTITELVNGNYVVCLAGWDNAASANAGAAMWCDGTLGRTGTVSSTNALIGNAASAMIGYNGVKPLTNGNYVVASNYWHNGAATNAGAVTWGNGTTGLTGLVSASNSLVGSEASTNIGSGGVTPLPNGNYVVCSPYCKIGSLGHAGAATWCDGTTGRTGTISAANSLVGAVSNDQVGLKGAVVLQNGNYVVVSQFAYHGDLATAGAVTWCDGAAGRTGLISPTNSLMGGQAGDMVGNGGVTPLANGHYVVCSPAWKHGAISSAGAITWGNGNTGIAGAVAALNSLVGNTASDQIGYPGVVALPNGNYVVPSSYWDNGTAVDAGALTWGNGMTGVTGPITPANSLVGSTTGDQIGYDGLVVLPNGNYVVRNFRWDNGAAVDAGAVTWGSGSAGVCGVITPANSLVGSTTNDRVGEGPQLAAKDGAYVFSSPKWNNGGLSDAGAVMLLPPAGGVTGGLSSVAGVIGTVATRGSSLSFGYDESRDRVVVGRPHANLVSLFCYQLVTSPADQFAAWAAAAGLGTSAAVPDAEPFADGVENLLKYAFNLNGSAADRRMLEAGVGTTGLAVFSFEAAGANTWFFCVEYLRRKSSGLLYQPECAANLVSFVPMTGTETVTPIDAAWERVVVKQPVDPVATPRMFGIVQVVLP